MAAVLPAERLYVIMSINAANPEQPASGLTLGDLAAVLNYICEVRKRHSEDVVISLRVQTEVLDRIADSLKRLADVVAAKPGGGAAIS
jgi:hypothetical protein